MGSKDGVTGSYWDPIITLALTSTAPCQGCAIRTKARMRHPFFSETRAALIIYKPHRLT